MPVYKVEFSVRGYAEVVVHADFKETAADAAYKLVSQDDVHIEDYDVTHIEMISDDD